MAEQNETLEQAIEEVGEPESETAGDSDRSMFGECYWILCGQFEDTPEDRTKSVVIAIGLATGVLSLTAGTTAILASVQNWPFAALLAVVGVGVLIFVWYVGLHRLDWLIIDEAS